MTTIVHSTCPHDCPSTCALEVEKLDPHHIGRIRGAAANSYTSGVICEKVARYAERVHHADRLTHPLKREGAKGGGELVPITWDDALDEVAERFILVAQQLGSETVWPLYYAGTMGLVQRGVIVVESIWLNSDYETGIGVNALVGADPGPPNGGAVFHDSAVWVKRAL